MPSFSSYPASRAIKMEYLGHSGAGKTGSLCSLAAAGYNVRILDLDGKAEVIRGFVTGDARSNPKSIYLREKPGLWTAEQAAGTASRISYVSVIEGMNIRGVKAIPKGDSWQKALQLLNDWKDGDSKLGNIGTWTEQDILVIDSFSRLCESARNFHLAMNNRLDVGLRAGTSQDNDYAAVYKMILEFLDLLKDPQIRCNIILVCHIVMMEETRTPQTSAAGRPQKGFAQVFGRAMISPQISQYFPHVLRAKSIGNEPSVRRTIHTNNDESVELITTAPLQVKPQYELATGLAEYFRDIHNVGGPQTETP